MASLEMISGRTPPAGKKLLVVDLEPDKCFLPRQVAHDEIGNPEWMISERMAQNRAFLEAFSFVHGSGDWPWQWHTM